MFELLAIIGVVFSLVGLYFKRESIYRLFYFGWFLQFSIVLIGLFFGLWLTIPYILLFLMTSLLLLFKINTSDNISLSLRILTPIINLFLIVQMVSNFLHWPFAHEQKILLSSLILFSIIFLFRNKNYNKLWYYLLWITYLLNVV